MVVLITNTALKLYYGMERICMHIQTVWSLICSTDWVSLGIIGLLTFAYVAIFIFVVYKYMVLRMELSGLAKLQQRMKALCSKSDWERLVDDVAHTHTMGAVILVEGITYVRAHGHTVSSDDIDTFLAQRFEAAVADAQQGLVALSIGAATAPLIGLFGTVWGLIHAFVSIGGANVVEISAIAPGMAEALLTTLAGLIVAIPSVIFYQYFQYKINYLQQQLQLIVDGVGIYADLAVVDANHAFHPKSASRAPVFS